MQTTDTTLYPQGLVFFTSLYALVRIQFLWGPVEPSTVLTSKLLINFCVGFRKKNVTIEKKKIERPFFSSEFNFWESLFG